MKVKCKVCGKKVDVGMHKKLLKRLNRKLNKLKKTNPKKYINFEKVLERISK
jgi:hypothetical protein